MPRKKKQPQPVAIDDQDLEFKDVPSLVFIKVSDGVQLLWAENPKLHNIGDVVESIQKHGFQELPKYDRHIGIKAGNGRIEALAWMEQDGKYELPRGLARIKETKEWVMPLLIGTDAESLDLARSYAVDSNNLTMTGGDFTALDISRLWDQGQYLNVLKHLKLTDNMPVSVDGDDLDLLAKILDFSPFPDDDYDDVEDDHNLAHVQVNIGNPEHYEDLLAALHEMKSDNPGWELSFVS